METGAETDAETANLVSMLTRAVADAVDDDRRVMAQREGVGRHAATP